MAPTQMSLPYALAARCVFGMAGLQAYTEENRLHAGVHALMDGMNINIDDGMAPMAEPLVTLTFGDGVEIERMVPRATGSAERPMQSTAIEAKFRELAGMSLSCENLDALWYALGKLEDVKDCSLIEALMVGNADSIPTFR